MPTHSVSMISRARETRNSLVWVIDIEVDGWWVPGVTLTLTWPNRFHEHSRVPLVESRWSLCVSLEGGLEGRGGGELEPVPIEERCSDQFGKISALSTIGYTSHTFVWVSGFYRAALYTSQFIFKEKTKVSEIVTTRSQLHFTPTSCNRKHARKSLPAHLTPRYVRCLHILCTSGAGKVSQRRGSQLPTVPLHEERRMELFQRFRSPFKRFDTDTQDTLPVHTHTKIAFVDDRTCSLAHQSSHQMHPVDGSRESAMREYRTRFAAHEGGESIAGSPIGSERHREPDILFREQLQNGVWMRFR